MRSIASTIVAAAITGALLAPAVAVAGARYFGSSGPTGTSIRGFAGGWGLNGGIEWPIRPDASFLVRGDAHWLPDDLSGGVTPFEGAMATSPTEVGFSAPGGSTANLWSVLAGFRLQPGAGMVRGYADALIGLGHLDARGPDVYTTQGPSQAEVRDDTNVALSLGAGLLLLPHGRLALFADAHFDFYYVPGLEAALVPIRMGVRFE